DGKVAMGGHVAHVMREPPREFIADERVAIFIVAGAQDDLIEVLHGGQGEEGIMQPARSVVAAEIKTEGKLAADGGAGALVIAPLNTNAGVDLEPGVILG